MSTGIAVPLLHAKAFANELLDLLMPGCARGAVAGSIRRERAEVHDIELVVEPAIENRAATDLWGTPVPVDLLDERVRYLVARGALASRRVEMHRADGNVEIGQRDGASYKALVYREIPVDLFIVRPPADWGVIFAIRTGPGDWNQRIVTDCQRFLRRVQGGRVYRAGAYVPCPEEADFFRAVGQPWVNPSERSVSRVSIR